MGELVAVLALAVSVVALTVSALLVRRQVLLMGRANQLPILIDLIRELRSAEFLERECYVDEGLSMHDPALGHGHLPADAADNLQHVKSLFNSIGALVAFGVIDERAAISIFGIRADRAWRSIALFAAAERGARSGNYAPFMEHFVALVREIPPEKVTDDLGLKKV